MFLKQAVSNALGMKSCTVAKKQTNKQKKQQQKTVYGKLRLIGKAPDAGKDWRQEEKGTKEDEMVGWHHRLEGHEYE